MEIHANVWADHWPEPRTYDLTKSFVPCSDPEPASDADIFPAARHELDALSQHEDSDTTSPFDIVDPALLVPPDHPVRGASRTDAGIVLDRELVALAGMDARGRIVQASLTRKLIDRRAWQALGFVRLWDYARERLGCSPRSLEEDARVLRALDHLPLMRASLATGQLPWTHARLLVRVATSENERELLEKATTLSTRELEAFLRAPNEDACESSASPTTHAINDEPDIRWSIPVSRTGRRMWKAACELASRSAGGPLSPAQVLELVTAESCGAPTPEQDWAPSFEEHERRIQAWQSHDRDRGLRAIASFLAETGVTEGFAWLDPARRDPGPAEILDSFLDGLDDLDAFELDRRLRGLRAVMQRIDYQLATLLRIGSDRRLFREIGFATVKLYVESRLGCSARRIWSLLAIERECWRSGQPLRDAWREGRISHLAACTLLPVMSAQHGDAWIRRAGEVTLRHLADEVSWALDNGEREFFSSRPAPPPAGTDVRADGLADLGEEEVQMRAHGQGPRDDGNPHGAVRLSFRIPVSLAALLEMQLSQHRRRGDGLSRTFERLVALAILEWTSATPHRDPIFERDGWRCSVPGCSSRQNLHDHHVVFRSHGGGNGRENRTTVCAAHHLHGIHEGIVRVTGEAPNGLEWEIGCSGQREPLMRLHGECYA